MHIKKNRTAHSSLILLALFWAAICNPAHAMGVSPEKNLEAMDVTETELDQSNTATKDRVSKVVNAAIAAVSTQTKKRKNLARTTEREFPCIYDGCGKAFILKHHLKEHMRIHTGEKPYKCTHHDCSKAFNRNSDLTRHMLSHTGEKPHKCTHDGCDKAFVLKHHLKEHMHIHTGEKPYKCTHDGCSRAFNRNSDLTRHMCSHTGEKPYKYAAQLMAHKSSAHFQLSEPDPQEPAHAIKASGVLPQKFDAVEFAMAKIPENEDPFENIIHEITNPSSQFEDPFFDALMRQEYDCFDEPLEGGYEGNHLLDERSEPEKEEDQELPHKKLRIEQYKTRF